MPTLLLEDIPSDVYERLQRRAASRQRPLSEEALLLLREALHAKEPSPPLPDLIPTEEMSAPFDLPLPDNVVPAKTRLISPPLPDPFD